MMTLIELTYKKPIETVIQFVDEHRDFLQRYYDDNTFLVSGPKDPREGGIIIAFTDQETAQQIMKADPFYRENIADYRFIEFIPKKYHPAIASLID